MEVNACKSIIHNEEKAKEYNVAVLKIDNDRSILVADIAYVPENISLEKYLDYLKA